ncbi:MAG TPA: PfkB family carbohydrate kinase, partial [Miltoncostaeaceae bacterium]|nr:PfkB family carbohydrate kinase [Miltoncostaeaceae bacterium]
MSDGPVVVLGDVMSDVSARLAAPPVPGSDTAAVVAMRPGGGGANAAAWLAWLGVPVVLAGRVGDDEAGRGAARALAAAGVTARLAVAPGATGACVVIVGLDGERTMLTDAGANARLAAADLPHDAFRPGASLHLSGYALLRNGSRAAALAALAAAREAGMPASVDAASTAPLAALGGAAFLGLVREAGLIIPTLDEAEVLTGIRDPEAAASRLLEGPRRGRPEARRRRRAVARRRRRGRARAGRRPAGPRGRQHRRRRRLRGG